MRNRQTLSYANKACFTLFVITFLISACVLPSPEPPSPEATSLPGISDAMLTAAAMTIIADLETLKTPAAFIVTPSPTETPPAAIPTMRLPSPAPNTETPAPAATSLPTATNPAENLEPSETSTPNAAAAENPAPSETSTLNAAAPEKPAPSETSLPPATQPVLITVVPITVVPFNLSVKDYGSQFVVNTIYLNSCGDGLWSIFQVRNNGEKKLESLSIHIHDLSTGTVLLGPLTSGTPFSGSEHDCFAGELDKLEAGKDAFISSWLGAASLQGHSLRATIMLCAKENLKGACTQKVVDFRIP